MYKIIGVALGLLIASNAMANVVFNGNFETGDHSQWDELEWNTSRPEAEQFEIVTSPKREGQYSAKMTVHDGDEFESTGGERVQLERPGTYNENDGDEYWYSWSTYFPSDWQNLTGSPDDDWLLIADWHSSNPGPFEDVCQPLQFEINGQNQIIVRMITGNVEGYDCYTGPGTADYFDQVIVDSLSLGEWNDFVVHIKWKADNTGLLEVWHKSGNETNFTRVLNRENIPTLQYIGANIDSPYFILAHYRSEQQSHTSVLYQDGFKQMSSVGDLDEQYRIWWQPHASEQLTWQWDLNDNNVDTSFDVDVYDVDLFDTPQSKIDELHNAGRKVICYFSAGSWEDWRSDAGDFPESVKGNDLDGWPGEKWLDIRDITNLGPIMEARLDLAQTKKCDGVEPDNVDGYTNTTGFPLTANDQLTYNNWLVTQAHNRNLSIGLKNDIDQINDLVGAFDWALNEQCYQYNECDGYQAFITADKPVFGVEYNLEPSAFCPQANASGYSWLKKNLNLDAWRYGCEDYGVSRADVDQNSTINSTDAMLTLRNSLGLDMSSTNWVTGAHTGDVNCDDTSNSTDAMLILRKSLGLDMSGTGWCVDNQVSYGESGTHTVATHTEVDTGNSVIYYPTDMSASNKVPVVFFNPGWQSSDPQDYETLLQFIASHGYAVIYAKDNYGDTASFISRFEKMLDGNNDILPKLDTSKIGVIGHSSGGGDTFKILEHFSSSGYGNNGRFLMALDPWFAFDMNSEGMQNLPGNTNLVILQFGSDGGATDPRIPLSEYTLLNSIANNKKDYQVYTQENADHSYPSGNKPVDQMQGVLKPLDALMDYTFNGTTGAHDIALEVGSDNPVGDGLQTVNAIDSYDYRCNSHKNLAEIMDIDYCNQYIGGKQYPADTIFDEKTIASVAQPDYLASYIGPVFGNKVTRITDRANQTGNAKPYPKTQVWNADMSLIRLGYRIYNADDFSETTTTQNNLIRGSLTEMKWSTWEPNVFYGIDIRSDRFVFVRATIDLNNNIINYEDIVNNDYPEQSAIFLKTDYDELKLGKYEGNLDFQDNYVVFAGRKKDTNELTLIVYHLQDNYGTHYNEITAQHDFLNIKWYAEDGNGDFDPNDGSYANQVFDWASISALGNYVIVNYKSKPGDAEQEYSIEQYDRQLNHIRRLADHGDHGDLGVDVNGKEVYVQFGFGSLNGESNIGIWMYPLDGSSRVRLLPDKYNGGHISCRNYQRPGWCYANTRYVWNGAGMREAFAIKLDDSGTVERFAQTHNTTANGGVVQVNPSPDGTQVLFNSDWGDTNNVLDTYNVQLP